MPPKKRQKTQEQRSQPHFVSSSSSSRYFRVEKVDDFTQQCIYHLVLDMVFLENETTSKNRDEKNKHLRRYSSSLPGPQAIALSRDTLQRCLLSYPYWVCEKSDGERRMMLFLRDVPPREGRKDDRKRTRVDESAYCPRGLYLIDRSFQIRKIANSELYVEKCCPHGNTLLDGEILVKDKYARSLNMDDVCYRNCYDGMNMNIFPEYLIFDVIAYDGDYSIGKKRSLEARLQYVAHIRSILKTEATKQQDKTLLPIRILGKRMVPLKHIESVLNGIHITNSSTHHGATLPTYQYKDNSRWNDNDGLVFTPEGASYTDLIAHRGGRISTPLLKWKWKEHNTIDFLIYQKDLDVSVSVSVPPSYQSPDDTNKTDYRLPLYVDTGGNDSVCVATALIDEQTQNKLQWTFTQLYRTHLIVECVYETNQSFWRILCTREHRNKPNYIKVAFHTMEILVENIEKEEIVRRVKESII